MTIREDREQKIGMTVLYGQYGRQGSWSMANSEDRDHDVWTIKSNDIFHTIRRLIYSEIALFIFE